MPKTIQLSDERYKRLLRAARTAGFEIKPGPGGQTGDFVDWLLDQAPGPIAGTSSAEVWARFNARIMPQVQALVDALRKHGAGACVEFSAERGEFVIKQE